MRRLLVQKLDPQATLPTVANPGEDLGYDLFALEDTFLPVDAPVRVRTGIAATYVDETPLKMHETRKRYGLLIRDRSSLGSKGVHTLAGVVDAGYRGEIQVVMICFQYNGDASNFDTVEGLGYRIQKGAKIAQMIPCPVMTDAPVSEEEKLPAANRGDKGWGSSGR